MRDLRFTGLMLKPSLSSLAVSFGLTGTFLGILALSYTAKTGLIYDYIFGPDSSASLIETSKSSIEALNQVIFGNPTLNKILFFGFWMAIGLIVYLTLTGIWSSVNSAYSTVNEINYATAHKLRIDNDLKYRIILRIVAAMLWFIYSVFFLKIFLPFSILCGRISVGTLNLPSGWLYGLISIVVLEVSLHLHVVFARFFMLRPRLIGGWDDILETQLEDKTPTPDDSH